MKRLNFFPYYKELLDSRVKTTTLRLHPPGIDPGDEVMLTVGWDETVAAELHTARTESVYERCIGDLTDHDLAGESPDCLSSASALYVMSCIYRQILSEETNVRVVKFSHL
jgi:hypothetical protein